MTRQSHFNKGNLKMSIEQTSTSGVVQINGINYTGLDKINNSIKVHYLIYKIINISNGHYYIG